jgi:excisionase family DNA binding protein
MVGPRDYMLEQYHGADEAGRILGVHPETVKRLCRSGEIEAIKFRNSWLIHADDLNLFKKQYNPNPGRRPIGETKVKGSPS